MSRIMERGIFHSESIVQIVAIPCFKEKLKIMKFTSSAGQNILPALQGWGSPQPFVSLVRNWWPCLILRGFCLPRFLAALSLASIMSLLIKTDVYKYQSTGNQSLNGWLQSSKFPRYAFLLSILKRIKQKGMCAWDQKNVFCSLELLTQHLRGSWEPLLLCMKCRVQLALCIESRLSLDLRRCCLHTGAP